MSALRDRLAVRLRTELATYREALEADAPVVQAHAAYDAPAILQWPGGKWHAAYRRAPPGSRSVTYREALAYLEERVDRFAELEAASITGAASLLIEDAEVREQAMDHVVECWPWTTVDRDGDLIFLTRHQLHMQRLRLTKPNITAQELGLASNPWPEGIEPLDVIQFVAESHERSKPGSGKEYRDWCMGVAEVRVYSDVTGSGTVEDPCEFDRSQWMIEPSANTLRDRTGKPDSITIDVQLRSGEEVARLITGEQLASLYRVIPETIRMARAVERRLGAIVAGDAQRHLLQTIAPLAIAKEKGNPDREAVGRLAEVVRHHLELFLTERPEAALPRTSSAALCRAKEMDELFATYLERLGERGQFVANKIRTTTRSPGDEWRLWRPEARGERFLVSLAGVLWSGKVAPEIKVEAQRRQRNYEALAWPVHIELVKLHSRTGVPNQDSRQLVFNDGSTISFDAPLLDAETLAVVSRGIELLGTVDAHRVLRWEVSNGYRRWIDGEANPNIFDIERGYGELAESLGIRDKGAPQRLRAILMAQRTCAFPLPGPGQATGNLIILSEWKGSGRRPGRVRIELGSVLMPTYVHELRAGSFNGRELSTMQRLVPLVALPPFVGRERDHGAQATLSMLITRELRLRAAEIFREGGVRIELDRWAALAVEARIPRTQVAQQLRPILDRWTRDGDDGPAFLKTVGQKNTLYTLGDEHDAARRFLLDAGKREATGAAGGKRSVRAREAALTRATRKG